MPRSLARWIYTLLAFLFVTACGGNKQHTAEDVPNDFDSICQRGELRVLTLYSSTSYFLYRGEEMGYEYERIKQFADHHKLKTTVIVADNIKHLTEMLQRGEGDIIAYEMPIIGDARNEWLYCGAENITHQVLIQPRKSKKEMINDVVDLIGKDIYVEAGSKYEERINNLNDELGGGIRIHHIDKDTVVTEELIEMVSTGEIPYTLADNNLAQLNRTYYPNIDIHLQVSFPQRASWAVSKNSPALARAIDQWVKENHKSDSYRSISRRYFELSKTIPNSAVLSVSKGQISIYDHLFKKYAREIDWDWRILAAQAYNESHFDTLAVSWAGARGLMQLMPRTAQAFGVSLQEITNPEKNVAAAVKSIKSLNKSLSAIQDKDERLKFILAAYNSGLGHILDAMALAEKHGKNPHIWDDNVSDYLLLKSNPEYFNDEVCKFGYFKGRQTVAYVHEVLRYYKIYQEKIPL